MNDSILLLQLDGVSLCQPPRAWNVFRINYVSLWTRPPQLGGNGVHKETFTFWVTRKARGGQRHTVRPSGWGRGLYA
jgi:hypothetical protein